MKKIYWILIISFILFFIFVIYKDHTFKETHKERLIFYLGKELYHKKKVNINNYSNILHINNLKMDDNKSIKNIYNDPLKKLLIKTGYSSRNFSYLGGDIESENNDDISIITIIKNRSRYLRDKGVILRCFEENRHWGLYYDKPKDILFDDKKDAVIWRGVTTGQTSYPGNRFDLVKKWYNIDPQIDVGFNDIVQDKDEYKKYFKSSQSPSQMLENKYIISVEGNDKDSGLNWKLNSNSLVLMPKPLSISWLMESKLIPNYHYILLRNDFADLKDKFNWCQNNQEKCKSIIQNANDYMSQFKDQEKENKLEEEVIKMYFERIQ